MCRRLFAAALLTLAALLLAACGEGDEPTARPSATPAPTITRAASADPSAIAPATVKPGQMSAAYDAFTGARRGHPRLGLGSLLVLDYRATVRRGSLTISVLSPEQEVVWQAVLVQDGSDRVELVSILAGTYSIVVEGQETSGSFDVRWQVQ